MTSTGGRRRVRLPEGLAGSRELHELVATRPEETGQVVVGFETDRGLRVQALTAAGYQVYAVNPLAVARRVTRDGLSNSHAMAAFVGYEALVRLGSSSSHHPRDAATRNASGASLVVMGDLGGGDRTFPLQHAHAFSVTNHAAIWARALNPSLVRRCST
ncbi:hypothetical protein JOJ86_000146 [Rhodococcus percolatus]|nr:hypothetical protein [Rhodococcus opacus]MBP2202420.1 hypothetical protein [Rhodococcus opacus]CAG7586326.1 hypothetical protein E143388_02313 [Rhodococcus opacus]